MEILQIEIDKIKPDKKQPRKSIEIEDLKEMAQSIVTEGVINPIETDSDFVIITGERRWRASKIAGLKTVPVKVLKINAKERFRRQVIENIHNDTMSYDDTARALSKLKVDYFHPVKVINKGQPQTGVTFLSKMVGKSLGYIEERFDYLKASAPLQKAVKEGMPSTYLRAIKGAPEKYKKVIEKKILNKDFCTAEGARHLSFALKRSEDKPEVVKKLLKVDYSKIKDEFDLKSKVHDIAPLESTLLGNSFKPSEEISKIGNDFKAWVKKNHPEDVNLSHLPRIVSNLDLMKVLLDEWLRRIKVVKESENNIKKLK